MYSAFCPEYPAFGNRYRDHDLDSVDPGVIVMPAFNDLCCGVPFNVPDPGYGSVRASARSHVVTVI